MLANSNYINSKRHHYLIFEEDKNSAEIVVSKKLAELYTDDLKYTQERNAASKEIYKEYYELPKEGEVKPVFFVKEGDRLIFGFTPYLRIPAKEIYTAEYRRFTKTIPERILLMPCLDGEILERSFRFWMLFVKAQILK